ncbi:MAG: sigma-70 family RNA polymerase sigma factor [Myxacorys chilensis ATA2-1-KO14]|jgi:RNA polymerase sporulation-specific sigma factor|nr:sigma-70 family RNA polymerase sigma factor [Myxacorys chilensis ATA2-1-KO14]
MISSDLPASVLQWLETFIERKSVDPIARRQTRNTAIAWEDAVQAAHEKLWRVTQQGCFRSGGETEFYHWAMRVACFAIIDYCRQQHSHSRYDSLDQVLPGTDIPLLETLIDEFDGLDAIDRADWILKFVEIITDLNQRYPKRGYLKIWQGLVQGKTQSEIACELGVEQPEICRRWKQVRQHIVTAYSQFEGETIAQQQQQDGQRPRTRRRSTEEW